MAQPWLAPSSPSSLAGFFLDVVKTSAEVGWRRKRAQVPNRAAMHDDGRVQRRRPNEAAILAYMPTITPKTYAGVMAWIMCIYLLLFAVPPATPPEAMHRYNE